MKWLVILRAVTGTGKKTTAHKLVQRLGANNATCLNMDVVEVDQINRMIEATLKFQYVIAHMYSGEQNTSDPASWISRFKDSGFHIISFVLNISLDAGKKRCLERDKNRTEEEYGWLWERFNKPPFSDFAKKADVKEISVDAEQSTDAMCDQILKAIEENTSRKL